VPGARTAGIRRAVASLGVSRLLCIEKVSSIFKEEVADMKVTPLHDRILVLRVDSDAKTAGGIIIPDTAKEKPQEGKIIAAGPGKLDEAGKRVSPEVKAGDRILFTRYGGTEVRIDGKEYLIMKEGDVLGVIES
jgi:chaperonin GroES